MRKIVRVILPSLIAAMFFMPLAVSIISINFDDGYRSDLVAKQIMDQYGFKATAFIVVNPRCLGGAEGRMNPSEITLLYKDGWDIESHGYNHKRPKDLTHAEFAIQYNLSRDILNASWPTVTSYASPFSNVTSASMAQIRKYYKSQRCDGQKIVFNRSNSFDRYYIQAFDVTDDMPMRTFEWAVNQAKGPDVWAVLVYHHVYNDPNSTWSVSEANFSEQMAYLHQANITVLTNRQVLDIWCNGNAIKAIVKTPAKNTTSVAIRYTKNVTINTSPKSRK